MKQRGGAWVCVALATFFWTANVFADARWSIDALQPVVVGEQVALPVEIYYVYRHENRGTIAPLTNGSILRDGDAYGIVFRPHQSCFVYIFQVEADGGIVQLFPQQARSNPVQRGVTYYLPAEDLQMTVGASSPMRQLYFLALSRQDASLEDAYQEYRQKQAGIDRLRGEIARDRLSRWIQEASLSSVAPLVNLPKEREISIDSPDIAEEIRRVLSMKLPKQLDPQDIVANLPPKGLKGFPQDDLLNEMPVTRYFNLFQAHTATIFRESHPVLHEYGKALAATGSSSIVIAAHADEVADEQAAFELSRQRAETVKEFFLAHFHIAEDRFIIRPYGNQQPFITSRQDEATTLNNRIELIRIR